MRCGQACKLFFVESIWFYYIVYYHVSEGKLEPRAKKDKFVGFGSEVKSFRIWSPSQSQVILWRSVILDENFMLNLNVKSIVVPASSDVDEQVEL